MSSEEKKKKLEQYLERACTAKEGIFPVELNLTGTGGRVKITAFLDSDTSVSLEDCAKVSRILEQDIDESGLFDSYVLEVSSAGMSNPLKVRRQYLKNRGRNVKIVRRGGTVLTGKLTDVREDEIVLVQEPDKKNPEEKTHTIPFNDIKTTHLIFSFK